jgi:hypothetical protein
MSWRFGLAINHHLITVGQRENNWSNTTNAGAEAPTFYSSMSATDGWLITNITQSPVQSILELVHWT